MKSIFLKMAIAGENMVRKLSKETRTPGIKCIVVCVFEEFKQHISLTQLICFKELFRVQELLQMYKCWMFSEETCRKGIR